MDNNNNLDPLNTIIWFVSNPGIILENILIVQGYPVYKFFYEKTCYMDEHLLIRAISDKMIFILYL